MNESWLRPTPIYGFFHLQLLSLGFAPLPIAFVGWLLRSFLSFPSCLNEVKQHWTDFSLLVGGPLIHLVDCKLLNLSGKSSNSISFTFLSFFFHSKLMNLVTITLMRLTSITWRRVSKVKQRLNWLLLDDCKQGREGLHYWSFSLFIKERRKKKKFISRFERLHDEFDFFHSLTRGSLLFIQRLDKAASLLQSFWNSSKQGK